MSEQLTEIDSPYGLAWQVYRANGWNPLPVNGKGQTPLGSTGYAGPEIQPAEVMQNWAESAHWDGANITIRPPKDGIALDFDLYKLEGELPPELKAVMAKLPKTFRSSARMEDEDYDGETGIRLFRLPAKYAAQAEYRVWRGNLFDGLIDVIRFGHRQVVCSPSIHPKRETEYQWMDEATGELGAILPPLSELPELPEDIAALLIKPAAGDKKTKAKKGLKTATPLSEVPEEWMHGTEPCRSMRKLMDEIDFITETARHEAMLPLTMKMVRQGEQGHEGLRQALDACEAEFVSAVEEDRDEGGEVGTEEALAEFYRAVTGAATEVSAEPTPAHKIGCCASWKTEQDLAPGAKGSGLNLDTDKGLVLGESAVAKVFARLTKDQLQYETSAEQWLRYDGTVWSGDSLSKSAAERGLLQTARVIVNDLKEELEPLLAEHTTCDTEYRILVKRQEKSTGPVVISARMQELSKILQKLNNEIEKLVKRQKTSLAIIAKKGPLDSALKYSATRADVATSLDQFDQHITAINTPTGLLDLSSGTVAPSSPEHRVTKVTRGKYRPGCVAGSRWESFLLETFGGDVEMVNFMQDLFGACGLPGEVLDHLWALLFGPGRTGKSTFIEALLHAIGDYGVVTEPTLLTASKNDKHPTGLMDLRGARIAVSSELAADAVLDTALMKRVTGGDPIKARAMRKDFTTFDPQHFLAVAANHLPDMPTGGGEDSAVWRRMCVIPFVHVVAKGKVDKHLNNVLRQATETDAILTWLYEGYQRVAERGGGFIFPASVLAATARYREREDQIAAWAEDVLTEGVPDDFVSTGTAYESWKLWVEKNIDKYAKPGQTQKFVDRLEQHPGLELHRTKSKNDRRGRSWLVGVKFKNTNRWGF